MITIVTTRQHRYTTKGLRRRANQDVAVRRRTYDWLFGSRSLETGTLVLTDFDRLTADQLRHAGDLAREVRETDVRVLNMPADVRMRYDLLHFLHRTGRNPYRVWRAVVDPQLPEDAFPVFLKSEGHHRKPLGGLLADQAALTEQMRSLRASGVSMQHLLVTEFVDAPIREGVWQRHTTYRIGDEVFAGLPIIQDSPFVKFGTAGLAIPEDYRRCVEAFRDNHYQDELSEIFDLARIDYGRADYTIVDGRPVIFEINTNPDIPRKHWSNNADYLESSQQVQSMVIAAVHRLDRPGTRVRLKSKR